MYNHEWFKDISHVYFAPGYDPKVEGSLNDLAVVELAKEFEQGYVRPACFNYRDGLYKYDPKTAPNYSGPLWVSLKV